MEISDQAQKRDINAAKIWPYVRKRFRSDRKPWLLDASSRWAASGADAQAAAGRAAGAGAAGDDGDDAGIVIVGMSMSSSMLIIIMVPLTIGGAGYAGAVLPTLPARLAQCHLS
ncbi:hypothetical protein [Bradyrhizobium ottawaense]|uniref:hypothetical protein n=1 Tax=Bradyrhizobium ottawaense TaxID=931866 RepID=UPI003FA0FD5C